MLIGGALNYEVTAYISNDTSEITFSLLKWDAQLSQASVFSYWVFDILGSLSLLKPWIF